MSVYRGSAERRQLGLGIFRIVGTYVVVASAWIAASDHILSLFVRDPEVLTDLQTAKGWAFVIVTATLLTVLVSRWARELSREHAELLAAYDATVEGWSRALSLKEDETERHSERVTELAVALARRMGVPEDQLVHVRWGALLHDIGKIGVPDSILLKPGPLDEAEWEVMRQHPIAARALLEPIEHLRAASDIPYCHHERWDGTGYPRGLKGEDIPLTARVFAVVDVWDALTSDRPYRPAWSEERAIEYLREQSGRQFDPAVVAAFEQLLLEEGYLAAAEAKEPVASERVPV